ncbi:MAG: DUF1353 domain-containing protein [Desulfobacterales bacterium]
MKVNPHFPDPVYVSVSLGPSDFNQRRMLKRMRYFMAHDAAEPVIVPKGSVTDYASIPRIFWPFLPPWGRYGPAAIVHDYLYARAAMTVPDPDNPSRMIESDRKVPDRIFLLTMAQLGVGPVKRYVMYFAVRLFARSAYQS